MIDNNQNQNQLSILYTEDTPPVYESMVPFLEIFLDSKVTHIPSNHRARELLLKGKRFDVNIFGDDRASIHGSEEIKLSIELATQLNAEKNKGLVICTANPQILFDENYPYSLEDPNKPRIERWDKRTEINKMVAWIAACNREGTQIPRAQWLKSVGEDTRYDILGTGNEVELSLNLLKSPSCDETHRGAFNKIDLNKFFERLRNKEFAIDVLNEMLSETRIKGEKET